MAAIGAGYVVVFLVTNLLLKALYRIKEKILVGEEAFNHTLVRGFMEMVVFRVNRRFRAEIERAEGAAGEIVRGKAKMKMIHEAFFTAFAVLVGIFKIGIILYGWRWKALTIGEIVALIALIDNAYTPVAIFNVLYIDYKLDLVAFRRYAEFLDAKEDTHLATGRALSEIAGGIALKGVSFAYEGRTILEDFSLEIEKGRSLALVGESGSGKSTIVKLLAGLIHPASGAAMLDGQSLDEVNLNSYYGYVAYLPQESSVFDGSLRENLAFDAEIPDADLIDALGGAGLMPLFEKLPRGLDTPLGERGVTLSGGERQQLALARLAFSRARVVLFDEATSAIDNLTEQAVLARAMERLAGRTLIAVAHRLDSVKNFDEIVVLREGKIVERGDFDSLMRQNGAFRALYERAPKSPRWRA
jgi:ATP-binding cassette subfamily B protein